MPVELIVVIVAVLIVFSLVMAMLSRVKKCPSDKVMVIYGKVGKNPDGSSKSAKCIHGGAAFVLPLVQSYQYLDLTPISIQVDLTNALSRQNIRIDVPSRFTVGISTEQGIMQNAAERLLGLQLSEIQELSKDIIFGQLRLIIATMDIEEINTDRDKFLEQVSRNVETELKKIGLRLINVNVTDINDESGYIIALGKEAAAKAINDAKKSVAEQEREGAIGEANARMEQRIKVSEADSVAIQGENKARIDVAMSNAQLREKEAEASRIATTAEKIQGARALEESYAAEQAAEAARFAKEKATLEADVIVQAEIKKREIELQAEAEAEEIRRRAKGEADALYAKMEAEAKGIETVLKKQAAGFAEVVSAAGGDPNAALKLLIADKLEDLMRIQVDAIKNIRIDKVTVWDSGNGANGKSSTSNFLSGLMKSVPPLEEVFALAGMQLPELLGKKLPEETSGAAEDAAGEEAAAAETPSADENAVSARLDKGRGSKYGRGENEVRPYDVVRLFVLFVCGRLRRGAYRADSGAHAAFAVRAYAERDRAEGGRLVSVQCDLSAVRPADARQLFCGDVLRLSLRRVEGFVPHAQADLRLPHCDRAGACSGRRSCFRRLSDVQHGAAQRILVRRRAYRFVYRRGG